MAKTTSNASSNGVLAPSRLVGVAHVSGTHYQVGFKTGRIFSSNITSFCDQCDTLTDDLLPFYRTDAGREVYEEYRAVMMKFHPQYEDELRGLADGSGVEYHKICLLHIRCEMLCILGKRHTYTGCSDVMINYKGNDGKQHSVLAHNEDGHESTSPYVYIVNVHIKPDPYLYPDLPEEHYVSFAYPGMLIGSTMGANHYGVVWSVNTLFPKIAPRKRTVYNTMTRTLATAQNLKHAESIIAKDPVGCSYGISVNLAETNQDPSLILMMNIEVAPRSEASTTAHHAITVPVSTDPQQGLYYHFNMYRHMNDVDQNLDQSSVERERVVQAQKGLLDRSSVLAVLGNTDHPVYPVYRNGKPPDTLCTIATSVCDLMEGTFSIYTGNPVDGRKPILTFPIISQPA